MAGCRKMSDLTSRIITLREELISKRVPVEIQHECVENLMMYYELHRDRTGSYKHLQGDHYSNAMKERLDYAYSKTLDYLKAKGYGKWTTL